MTSALLSVEFKPPLASPSPTGLFAATTFAEDSGPLRWLQTGVQIRPVNYGSEDAFGVWDVDWCEDPDDNLKTGDRVDEFLDPFLAKTVWAWDHAYCGDVRPEAQAEVRERAQQLLRLYGPKSFEAAFAIRILADAPTALSTADLIPALGALEAAIADTGTTGFIHAAPKYAAEAAASQLIVRSGAALKTPLGNTWVFGAGYTSGLDDTLVATSATYGWRGPADVTTQLEHQTNEYVALAEQSIAIGYESVIAQIDVS